VLTFAENFTAMSKNIGFRVAEGVNERFEEFFTKSGKSTKGEAFASLLELAEQTSVNTEELTNQLTDVNEELEKKNTMLTEVNAELAECKQQLTDANEIIRNGTRELEGLVVRNRDLTEKIELLTAEKQPTISVPPEWEAKAKKVAEINGLSHPHEVLWQLYYTFESYRLDSGLKRLSDSEISEIEKSFQK